MLQAKTYNTLCLWVLKHARRCFWKYSEIFPKNTEIFPKMFERILQKSEIFSKRWEQSNALRSGSASLSKSKKGFAQSKSGIHTRREGKSNKQKRICTKWKWNSHKQKRICTRKEIPKCLLFQLHTVLGFSGVLRLSRLRFFGSSRNVTRCEKIAVNQRMAAKRSRSLLDDGR